MQQIEFAGTGTRVSPLVLGCLPFGTKVSEETSRTLLDTYVEAGGNFLDTANNYAFWEPGAQGGESEEVLGRWMADRGLRSQIVLATKVGARPRVSPEEFFRYAGDPWADLTEGLSARTLVEAVEASLRRLRTDRIDLLYAHVDDRRTAQDETLEALDRLVRSGKVLHLGCSNFKLWRLVRAQDLAEARGLTPFRAVQMFHTYWKAEPGVPTSLADPMDGQLFDYVRSGAPLTLLGYTPQLWGTYTDPAKFLANERTRPFRTASNQTRLGRLQTVARNQGATVPQVLYAWMLHSSPVVLPLVAVSSLDQLHENLGAAAVRLDPETMAYLDGPVI